MKILAKLPDLKHFRPLESSTPGRYLWEDKASSAIRIQSDFPDPFNRSLVIIIRQQKMKTDQSEYPYRIIFKCFESGDNPSPGIIVRERFKGVFAWSNSLPKYGFPLFFGIPLDKNEWLGYSIYFSGKPELER